MSRNLIILSCVAALAAVSTGCQQLKARDNLNKGVQAYKNAKYPEAVAFFQKAVELDPTFKTTHLYLATAYMSQYIPGAESPENVRMADRKSTRLNSSHLVISYAVFCLKKKKKKIETSISVR